jgi:Aldo/keto reductase family
VSCGRAQATATRSRLLGTDHVATERGVSRAQVALVWLRSKPVVSAPIVGATQAEHLADAVASLDIELTAEEIDRLEAPYIPRHDFQGISDPATLAAISKCMGIAPADEDGKPSHRESASGRGRRRWVVLSGGDSSGALHRVHDQRDRNHPVEDRVPTPCVDDPRDDMRGHHREKHERPHQREVAVDLFEPRRGPDLASEPTRARTAR